MNAEVRNIKTPAEQALSSAFAAARDTLPGKGDVAALRAEAFKRFETRGLPHRRVEDWKYTDLRALMRDAYPLALPPDAAALAQAKDAGAIFRGFAARKLVFVDGTFVPALSDLSPETGLTIGMLADALTRGDADVTAHLAKAFATEDVAVALNTALMGNGAVIRVTKGAAVKPIHLVFASTGTTPVSAYVRSLIVVEEGAQALIIESHESGQAQVNAAVELIVGDRATLDYCKTVQARGLHIGSLLAHVGADATLRTFALTLDSAVVRNQNFIRFDGEHTHGGVRGITLLRGKEHADTTLLIQHARPHCESREQFKAVLDDQSHSVFQGKIEVKQAAQKTDAKMMTRALLLSDEAEADAKPELEIFADDVVCGHGATVGALDKGLKFYLMSRGITDKEAEALLIQAFIGETLEDVPNEALREALMNAALGWMSRRAGSTP